MSGAYYRSGQAARMWAISSHLVRRLCEAGVIEAELTAGRQWKIPHSEVERIKREGIPEIPSSIEADDLEPEQAGDDSQRNGLPALPSDGVMTSAEQVVVAENPVKKMGVSKEIGEMRNWFRERERQDAEMQARESQAVLDQAARVEAQDRIAWHDSCMVTALRSLPQDAPADVRLAVRATVSEALAGLGPGHSAQLIEPLVAAAVAKALSPWNQAKDTIRAIEMACDTLPWGAKSLSASKQWRVRANEAAAAAIKRLPPDSTYYAKFSAGTAAVQQISSEFEYHECRDRVLQQAYLWNISNEQREEAKEAVREKLQTLPVGTPLGAMERAREQVLLPFREATKRKERVDRALGHIRKYLEELWQAGETDFEDYSEVWHFAKQSEGRVRHVLLEELQQEDLSDDELTELVEEVVDEQLD